MIDKQLRFKGKLMSKFVKYNSPKDFEKNINNLLNSSINFDLEVLSNINDIVKQLEKLLQDEDLLNLCVNVYSKDKE